MGWSGPGIFIDLSAMICILLNWKRYLGIQKPSLGTSAINRRSCRRTLADRSSIPPEPPHPGGRPVFGQHPVGDANDVGGDPVSRASSAGESPVDDDKVAFGHDHARLILEGRGSSLDKVEETLAARLDVGAVLNIVGRPEALGGRLFSPGEQGV